MSTTGTSYRKGTSTIMGTLIFVGIIFTAFIPMMLVMRQADTLHDLRKHELDILDQERMDEEVYVYVFNDTESSGSLTLRVENWGYSYVNIKKIWINDACYPLEDFNVQSMNWLEGEVTGFTPVPDKYYTIKITTDRGNIFYEMSGSLYCNIDGQWYTELFTIYINIKNQPAGWYDVNVTSFGFHVPESPIQIHKSRFETAYDYCNVLNYGTFHVTIERIGGEIIYNKDVTIPWPNGPRSVTITA